MDTLEQNRCIICGAIIGDNNATGIGFGCMGNVVKPAVRDCFREIKGLDVWIAKSQHVRTRFLSTFEGKKFRSEFRKSFFSSMKSAERISKKQLDIMIQWLGFERIYIDLWEDVEKKMRNDFNPELECPELYEERIAIHRKLYLSGKKDQKEDIAA
jgi:hypothetical protein